MTAWTYSDGGYTDAGKPARRTNTGDCVARALAIAMQRPYAEVYAELAEGKAEQRQGKRKLGKDGVRTASRGISVKRKWFQDYMRTAGWAWTPTMGIGTGCKVHLRADELPAGRIVASLSRHYCAVIDGVIHDLFDPSRDGTRCVYGYWSKP